MGVGTGSPIRWAKQWRTTSVRHACRFCLLAGMAADMANDRPRESARTLANATEEYYWGVFLKGYRQGDPESKAEFDTATGLNRKQRRRLESKTRRLRERSAR
jgi:hypothetical protein